MKEAVFHFQQLAVGLLTYKLQLPQVNSRTFWDKTQTCKLNREDAMDSSRRRKLIKDGWWSG